MRDQKPMWTRWEGGFSVIWVTKLLISPVKQRIFCPKTTKFGPKLAVLVNLGQAMQAYSVPCWWVGWWFRRAGCISQDTYLLYTLGISTLAQSLSCGSSCSASPLSWNATMHWLYLSNSWSTSHACCSSTHWICGPGKKLKCKRGPESWPMVVGNWTFAYKNQAKRNIEACHLNRGIFKLVPERTE